LTLAASAPSRPAPTFIARWDLDKTYLRTDFETLGDLLRTAVERPDRKRSVPGAAALLRELGRTGARIHILSGSPRQMRSKLEEKLRIDRVRWDELTLKPNLSNLMRMRFRALRDQLGYKLPMLLDSRVRDQALNADSPMRETLVGDDAEADAFVYSLYSDVCSGTVSREQLKRVLTAGRLYPDAIERCLRALDGIECGPVVQRILIHLDRQTPPSMFGDYGFRVVPFYNYLQAAFVLAEDGCVEPAGVLRIASEFVARDRFDADALARSYLDLMRRGHVRGAAFEPLCGALGVLRTENTLTTLDQLSRMCELLEEYLKAPPEPRDPALPKLDYVNLALRHRGGRNRKKRS
jgi:hypothetical protein